MPTNWFKNKLKKFEKDKDFQIEKIKLEITEKICKKMKELNYSRKDFAKILGTTPAYITKLLNGKNNFTLDTLFSINNALGLNLSINFTENNGTNVLSKSETINTHLYTQGIVYLSHSETSFIIVKDSDYHKKPKELSTTKQQSHSKALFKLSDSCLVPISGAW